MIILLAVVYTMTTPSVSEEMVYSDVVDLFKSEQVESFVIRGSDIIITKKGAQPGDPALTYSLYDVSYFLLQMGDLIDQQHAEGIIKDYDLDEGFVWPWWASMIPYLLLLVVFFALWYYMMNKSGGGAPGVGKFGKVTVNKFMLHYAAAGDDPYDTVVTYDYVNAALSTLIPICEEKFIVKESDIRTDIDFTADKTKVDVELCATIRLAQVMHMLFAIAFGALGVLIRNKRRLRREKKQGIVSDGIEVDVALEKDTDEAETSQINKDNNTEQNTQAEERTDSNGQ